MKKNYLTIYKIIFSLIIIVSLSVLPHNIVKAEIANKVSDYGSTYFGANYGDGYTVPYLNTSSYTTKGLTPKKMSSFGITTNLSDWGTIDSSGNQALYGTNTNTSSSVYINSSKAAVTVDGNYGVKYLDVRMFPSSPNGQYAFSPGGWIASITDKSRTKVVFRFYEPGTNTEVSFKGIISINDIDDCEAISIKQGYNRVFRKASDASKLGYYWAGQTNVSGLKKAEMFSHTNSSTEMTVYGTVQDGSVPIFVEVNSTPSVPFTIEFSSWYKNTSISVNNEKLDLQTVKFYANSSTVTTRKVPKYAKYHLYKGAASLTGYTRADTNWYTNSACTAGATGQGAEITTGITGAINYYAKMSANTYTNYLYYNMNGGSGGPSAQSSAVAYPSTAKTFTVSSAAPTRTGYTFKGWSTSSSATTASYVGGNNITVGSNSALSNQSVTLYAVWSPIPYLQRRFVRYQNVDGSWGSYSAVVNQNYNYGSTVPAWSRAADSTYNAASLAAYTVTGAKDTYVDVSRKQYTLKFVKTTGVSSVPDDRTQWAGGTLSSTCTAATGYHLTKYVGTLYDGSGNSTWTGCSGLSSHNDSWTMNANRTITVYAEGNVYTNTLSYNANGGSGAPTTQTANVTYPNTAKTFTISSNIPTRTGYTFKGWSTSSTATSASYSAGGSITIGVNNNVGNQSLTLYAVWQANTYTNTLIYDANGGSNAPANQTATVTYPNTSTTFTVSSSIPTRYGWVFEGWYTAASGGKEVFSTYTVGVDNNAGNQTATIYAHWHRDKFTVTVVDVCRASDPGHAYNTELGRAIYRITYEDIISPMELSGGDMNVNAYYTNHKLTGDSGDMKVIEDVTIYRYFGRDKYTVTFDDRVQREVETETVKASPSTLPNNHRLGGITKEYWYGETASLSDYSGTEKDSNRYYEGFQFDHASDTSVFITSNYVFTRYFRYNPWTVIYNANGNDGDNASVSPSTNEVVRYTYYVDTRNTSHTANRPGWIFRGWHTDDEIEDEWYKSDVSSLIMPNSNLRLYAIYDRSFVINLGYDYYGGRDGTSNEATIWNHTPQFNFDWDDFIDEMTRGNGTYIAKFNVNDYEDDEGNVTVSEIINTGNTDEATGYNESTREIIASPSFKGWFLEGNDGNNIILKSGSNVIVKPIPGTSDGYVITGKTVEKTEGGSIIDADASLEISNLTDITLEAQYNSAKIKLPNVRRHVELHDEDNDYTGHDEDLFLGWFTKEQTPGATDGGVFVGRAGDEVYIKGDVELYPWFNVAPEITMSKLSNKFYEGQTVSYAELLTLVTVSDIDDYASNSDVDGLINWNGLKSFASIYSMNLDSMLYQLGLNSGDRDIVKNSINSEEFKPTCYLVKFDGNGVDANDNLYGEGTHYQTEMQIRNGLDTSKASVGDVHIYYRITDDGAIINAVNELYGVNYVDYDVLNSLKTVKYRIDTKIVFDNPPVIRTNPIYMYTDDVMTDVKSYILERQFITDAEDNRTEEPWWYCDSVSPKGETASNSFTKSKLIKSLDIVKVSDIEIASGYELDVSLNTDEESGEENICDKIRNCTTIEELFAYKTSNPAAFNHIKSFKATIDGYDQWGKAAGSAVCGSSEIERTIPVIMFNRFDDLTMNKDGMLIDLAASNDYVRYIDLYNLDTLENNDYWGSTNYGRGKLEETFDNYLKTRKEEPDSIGKILNSISNDKSRTVTINVFDYTK